MKKRNEENNKNEPTIAPGIDDHEELEKEASKKEIAQGDSTHVVTLSYDEVEPSEA